jgi:hypothetical protein
MITESVTIGHQDRTGREKEEMIKIGIIVGTPNLDGRLRLSLAKDCQL